jgi:hypothetical protein
MFMDYLFKKTGEDCKIILIHNPTCFVLSPSSVFCPLPSDFCLPIHSLGKNHRPLYRLNNNELQQTHQIKAVPIILTRRRL